MVTKEELQTANKYWQEREQDVWRVAHSNGLDGSLKNLIEKTEFDMNSFLFDLFDNGCASLETVDILEGLTELFEEEIV